MKSLHQFIIEALDQPYPWHWRGAITRTSATAFFTTDARREVYVDISFYEDYDDVFLVYETDFRDIQGFHGTRNQGDQFRTLATVREIIHSWLKENEGSIITFNGSGQRGTVYIRMVQQMMKSSPLFRNSYNAWYNDLRGVVYFYIAPRNINMNKVEEYIGYHSGANGSVIKRIK